MSRYEKNRGLGDQFFGTVSIQRVAGIVIEIDLDFIFPKKIYKFKFLVS